MRGYDGTLELKPSLIGTISAIGGTAVGAPIDTHGFADVLATLVAGAVVGSNTNYLDVKIQESASATGTGAGWTDIANGAINGTFDFDQMTFTGTSFVIQMDKHYERLTDSNRSRYIRAHATCSGTSGNGIRFSVNFLLGRPSDTLYVSNGVTHATGNVEYTRLV